VGDDHVREGIQVVRVDVVLPEGRGEPDRAQLDPAVRLRQVVRVLAGDHERAVSALDEPEEEGQPALGLPLLHEVAPAVFELLPSAKQEALEELVLLEGHIDIANRPGRPVYR